MITDVDDTKFADMVTHFTRYNEELKRKMKSIKKEN